MARQIVNHIYLLSLLAAATVFQADRHMSCKAIVETYSSHLLDELLRKKSLSVEYCLFTRGTALRTGHQPVLRTSEIK